MTANARQEYHVTVTGDGSTAVDLLALESALSKAAIKSAMSKGACWITRGPRTQRLRRAKRKILPGDQLHLYYDPAVLEEEPAEPGLVADLGSYSVWDKPFGLRSQGSKWGDHCTVIRWAEQHLEPERSGFVVHRLDRAANGLILVAHSRKTAAALSRLFSERDIEKHYTVRVQGEFPVTPAARRVDAPLDGKTAVSEIRCLEHDAGQSILDVKIETGRKHQVRRHLASLGFPVVGDRLYGDAGEDDANLQLTASSLSFRCPVSGEPVRYRLDRDV